LQGWRTMHGPRLRTDGVAKHGRSALVITIPAGQHSVTIATTRMRGWYLQEHRATGIELWMRTRQANGVAAFDLLANAFTSNQIMARQTKVVTVTSRWTRFEVLFRNLPRFPLGDLDLFSIELTGEPGTEFLLDDVQLLGRWRTD
jgi:hypothetical protein